MRPVLLASASPRRHELLALGGIDFRVSAPSIPEISHPGEAPAAFARRMSQAKARAAGSAAEPGAVVVAADTIVVLGDEIIGKPAGPAHAAELLRRLRGRSHRVLTAVTVLDTATGAEFDDQVEARVPMRAFSDAELDAYVASGDPLDKAGAYAIQYPAFQPVDLAAFDDCYANVMGLPVCCVLRLLARAGVPARLAHPPANCQRYDPAACPLKVEARLRL
jgi:MAF protein